MITTGHDIIKHESFYLIRLYKFEEDDFHKNFNHNITSEYRNSIQRKRIIFKNKIKNVTIKNSKNHKFLQNSIKLRINNKKNKQIYKETHNSLKESNNNITNYLCSICLDILIFPITSNCGHSFCRVCMYEYILNNDDCLICDKNIKQNKYLSNNSLNKIVKRRLLQIINSEFQSKYKTRVSTHIAYLKKRRISTENIKSGEAIDLRIENFIWKTGLIKEIKIIKNIKIANVIIYEERLNKYGLERYVNMESDMLASFGFYTYKDVLK